GTRETHAATVWERPIGVLRKLVYLDARERFIGHLSTPPWSPFPPYPCGQIARKAAHILPPRRPPQRRARAFRSAPALRARCRSSGRSRSSLRALTWFSWSNPV